jgi:two-component system OmpR family sensor kinase
VKRPLGLRSRMMLLFCAVVGVLLAGSFITLYAWLARKTHAEFDQRAVEAAAPVAADISSDGDADDVAQLNLPDEYFEVTGRDGRVLARSLNLAPGALRLPPGALGIHGLLLFDIGDSPYGRLRMVAQPVAIGKTPAILFLAMPVVGRERTLAELRHGLGALLMLSLAVMALVSTWYVGRSLRPIAALTEHASLLARRLETKGGALTGDPLPAGVTGSPDEIGQLGAAFDRLWVQMGMAVAQLRQFVSDASHELRTPLSVLRGETELVLGEPRTGEEYRRALEVIQDELGKLSRIVEGLFTLTLADAGQLRLAREPLYLNEVLEEACALAESRARSKDIRIERSLASELPYQGDETWLRQLFLSFLDNAVKYSPPGTRVRVSLEPRNGPGPQVEFSDEGPGIAPDHLPHIFERFYRAGADEAQSGGLGLAIAQAIVGACGGTIECSSRPGAGTRFTVRLPAAPPEANLNKN